jgi:cell division protease FtsH
MPRDERGWRVAPAPDGRGMPDPPAPKPHRSRGFLFVVLILLALNWGSLLLFQPGASPRVTVAFSPYFLHAVRSNQVASISSKGDTVEGSLRTAIRYPGSSATAIPTRLFSTELPAFANDNQLAQLLESHGVQINATSATRSTPLGVSLLLGFGG